jgi:hypothetical protein
MGLTTSVALRWAKSTISRILAAATATEKAYSGWSRLGKWVYGTIEITYPHNGKPVPPGKVEIGGKHSKPKGSYWLLTQRGDDYWPKCRINPRPDGTWCEIIHVGSHTGPRVCNVVLALTSGYTNAILEELRKKNDLAKNWDPINIKWPASEFCPVQAITLNVERAP